MQTLPNPVVRYLENLELELKKKVGVSPEDALCDAREHLTRQYDSICSAGEIVDDESAYTQFIDGYGRPTDVAQQYESSSKKNILKIPGRAPGWRICCSRCGRSAPAAKVGITRVAASSKHKYVVGWCHDCRFFRWMRLQKDLEKITLTPNLGVRTSSPGLRKASHRPWLILALILIATFVSIAIVLKVAHLT